MARNVQKAVSIPEPTNDVDALWKTAQSLKEAVEMLQGIRGNREAALLCDVEDTVNDLQVQINNVSSGGGGGGGGITDGTIEGELTFWDDTGGAWTPTGGAFRYITTPNQTLQLFNAAASLSGAFEAISVDVLNVNNTADDTIWSWAAGVNISYQDLRVDLGDSLLLYGPASTPRAILRAAGSSLFVESESAVTEVAFQPTLSLLGSNTIPHNIAGYSTISCRADTGYTYLQSQNPTGASFTLENYNTGVWRFNSPTSMTDPGTTFMRANNTTMASITEFAFDDNDANTSDPTWFFTGVDIGDLLIMRSNESRDDWGRFRVTGTPVDQTGFWTVVVEVVDTNGQFSNAHHVMVDWEMQSKVEGSGAFLPLAGGSMDAASKTIFPLEDDAATPTLAFGDGDTGLYESADDTLVLAAAGVGRFKLSAQSLGSFVSGGAAILNEISSSTNPVLLPADTDTDTGIGRNGSDALSLIAGGVEGIRITEAGAAITDIAMNGPVSSPNDSAAEVGFKGSPVNVQNGNYTTVLGDAGNTIQKESGGAGETITIDSNANVAYPIGTILFFANDGGGDLTIAITSDTLEGTDAATGSRTLGDDQEAAARKITATKWRYTATDL